mgnify:CR=1 FL=1
MMIFNNMVYYAFSNINFGHLTKKIFKSFKSKTIIDFFLNIVPLGISKVKKKIQIATPSQRS